MKLIPPWVKLLAILLLAGLLVGAFYSYGQQQFGLGETAERSKWLERENAELVAANAKIKDLEEKYRQQERDADIAIAFISSQYEKELIRVKADKDHTIAGLRDGSVRLCIPVTGTCSPGGGKASAAAVGTGTRDGGARAELSVPAAEFLVGLTSEADEVVKQLGACQAVIEEDRKMCGAYE